MFNVNCISRSNQYLSTLLKLITVMIGSFCLFLLSHLSLILADDPVTLNADAVWRSGSNRFGTSIAWGDVDNDGDLDLAVGYQGSGANRVYLNENGILQTDADMPWTSDDEVNTFSVAWGDVDNDGDLDLAAGNYNSPNVLYLNENGTLQRAAIWSDAVNDLTFSVVWGDVNGDDYLDLVVGNDLGQNKVYLNENGTLQSEPGWSDLITDRSYSVALGDFDQDNDLDLAVGNRGNPNKVYLNQGGVLQTTPHWTDALSDTTWSVAWGDLNNDGYLDLAVGNRGEYENSPGCQCYIGGNSKIYLNLLTDTLEISPSWTSNLTNSFTYDDPVSGLAWGDVDNDGDLDLAIANGGEMGINRQNKVFLNEGGTLQTSADNPWTATDFGTTIDIAWGDVDGDGDLDLAAANDGTESALYLNEGIPLQLPADNPQIFHLKIDTMYTPTHDIVWGDMDGDGDLDLAGGGDTVGNSVYPNVDGILQSSPSWTSQLTDTRNVLAWGDMDNDGDLDLAVGNAASSNRIYRNQGGVLERTPVWSDGVDDDTRSVAWGDVDGDGDLDLAVGNWETPSKIYPNIDGSISSTVIWSDTVNSRTLSLAWGDVDRDGDLDLAAGNSLFNGDGSNIVYHNHGGTLSLTDIWSDSLSADTSHIAWGDVDGDGDLDLAVGNTRQRNLVYINEDGRLSVPKAWSDEAADITTSIAWGDVDGDGDSDLAVANWGQSDDKGEPLHNKLYQNIGGSLQKPVIWSDELDRRTLDITLDDIDRDGRFDVTVFDRDSPKVTIYKNNPPPNIPAQNEPTTIYLPHPAGIAEAQLYFSPRLINSPFISITYILTDPENDLVLKIIPEYSLDGSNQWFPATLGPGGDGIMNLPASATGTTHTFVWHAAADPVIKNDHVTFRIRAIPDYKKSPILWPAQNAQSSGFRVQAAEWYVKLVDVDNNPVRNAQIYLNGQLMTDSVANTSQTNRAGLLQLHTPVAGQPIIALWSAYEQPTLREGHEGWAYRTFLTNLNLDDQGQPQPDFVQTPGEQRITLSISNSLTLFNIVTSIEWDATDDYLMEIEDAFRKASDYLYDVTDGQMAFGQVAIYDNAEHWADADFQFSTKNTVRPYAFIGGITSEDKAHTIRVGRFWSRTGGNGGQWNEPDGYRTLIHEFSHYALYLEDEYFVRGVDEAGDLIADQNVSCTDPLIKKSASGDATNASVMYWHYNASEFAGADRWNENCQATQQHLVNGKSDWETIAEHYGGEDWLINTPTSRGTVMAGPQEFPTDLLPFPEITLNNTGRTDGEALHLTITDPSGQPVHNALVALYTSLEGITIALDQGLTDGQGQIDIYGATAGDTIRAATFDGAFAGARAVDSKTSYSLVLKQLGGGNVARSSTTAVPHLGLAPHTNGDTLFLQVFGLAESVLPLNSLIIPGEGAGTPQLTQLAYSNAADSYVGTVSLSGVGLGTGRIQVSGPALAASINSDYNLQQAQKSEVNTLFSEDGNFEFHLPVDAISADQAYATVLPTGYVPGPLPDGLSVIGNAYEVRLSGAVAELEKAGVVRLHYHPEVMGVYTKTAIYFWDAANEEWDRRGGDPSETDNAWSVAAQRLGIYALMGLDVTSAPPTETIYLPIILK